jgi:hypothetical protein
VIYDHVLGAVHAGREPKLTGPYKENDPFHEPLVTYEIVHFRNRGTAFGRSYWKCGMICSVNTFM